MTSPRPTSLRNGQWAVLVLLAMGIVAASCAVLYWHRDNPNFLSPSDSATPITLEQIAAQLEPLSQRYVQEHKEEDLTQLIEGIATFLKQHATYPPGYVLMGQVLFEQGQKAKALAYLAEGLRLKPDQPEVLLMAGTFALMLDKPANAQTYFQQAIDLKPTHAPYYLHLGQSLFAQQKWDASAKAFEQAVHLDSALHVGYNSLADIHAKKKDWATALQWIGKAIEQVPLGKRPQHVVYLQKQASLLQKSGQTKQALMVLQKLTDTEQAQTNVMTQMAQYWASLGQPRQAAMLYENYLKITPKVSTLAAKAAHWRIAAGDLAKAQQHLMHLKLLDSRLPIIQELEQALAKATKNPPTAPPTP